MKSSGVLDDCWQNWRHRVDEYLDQYLPIAKNTHEPENLYQDVIALWHECESENLVDRSLEFYANYYLEGVLTKVDRASMLCGLEVRSPFLDVDLVEFALRLPPVNSSDRGRRPMVLGAPPPVTGLVPPRCAACVAPGTPRG